MKNISRLTICLMVVFSMAFTQNVSAETGNAMVRVGLESKFKDMPKISIGNKSISLGFNKTGNFHPEAIMSTTGNFSVTPDRLHYVKFIENLKTYDEAKVISADLKNSGNNSVVALIDQGNWGVYLGGFGTKQEAMNIASTKGLTIVEDNGKKVILSESTAASVLLDNGKAISQISGVNGENIILGDRIYRDSMEFYRTDSTIIPVNIIHIDKYLYSVVPSEMPATWHLEALKAQSVAARNYTATRAGIHKEQGYDLCDHSHCQNYIGAKNETKASKKAVDETSNIMIYHNNKIINAVYSSSSGGHTNNSEEVWTESLPYLRGVKEISEKTYKDWTRTFTLTELTEILKAKGIDIGDVQNVSIKTNTVSNRVAELTFTGTKGTKSVFKDEIRTMFNQTKDGSLSSNNFFIEKSLAADSESKVTVMGASGSSQIDVNDIFTIDTKEKPSKTSNIKAQGANGSAAIYSSAISETISQMSSGNIVVFKGKGWGHGVGMSQFGAKGMAEAGYSYDKILKHYYTGVEVR